MLGLRDAELRGFWLREVKPHGLRVSGLGGCKLAFQAIACAGGRGGDGQTRALNT